MSDSGPLREVNDLETLIGRCALQDQRAFLALYDVTSAKLYGVILRIAKREHWAEEILQDVYLKIWQSAGTYNITRGRPMTWLINIARNRAIDFLRGAEHAADERSVELNDELPTTLDPMHAADRDRTIGKLAECLKRFGEAQRRCLLKIYHEGYTPTEVARSYGHPIGTVKTWVRRGIAQIRACMEEAMEST